MNKEKIIEWINNVINYEDDLSYAAVRTLNDVIMEIKKENNGRNN